MRAVLMLALIAASTSVIAVDVPQSSPRDHRIQLVNYHPEDVVRVSAQAGYVSRIVFEPGEAIVQAVPGFPDGWSVEPSGHILLVRPLSVLTSPNEPAMQPTPGEWDTNLAIATNRRLYDFDLRLVGSAEAKDTAFYRIEFRYPTEERERARVEREQEAARENLQAVVDRLPAARNAEYSASVGKRSADIVPELAYDDGRFTYLQFPGLVEMPAVFTIGADGAESIANTHTDPMRDDVLVVDRVVRQLVLRLGRAVVTVHNDAFEPRGMPPENGTTVPDLIRTAAPGTASR